MPRLIEAFTTSAQGPFYAQRAWIGRARSESSSFLDVHLSLISFRVKDKLRSGELAVSGDQWPIFLFQGYRYDPEDPWNGLFRSTLLVSVGI
jgi:hypothetical protein